MTRSSRSQPAGSRLVRAGPATARMRAARGGLRAPGVACAAVSQCFTGSGLWRDHSTVRRRPSVNVTCGCQPSTRFAREASR